MYGIVPIFHCSLDLYNNIFYVDRATVSQMETHITKNTCTVFYWILSEYFLDSVSLSFFSLGFCTFWYICKQLFLYSVCSILLCAF